jgi:hypothetical protein
MIWNLKRGNVLIAINRGASSLFSSGFHWLNGNFWLGMQNLDISTRVQVFQRSRPASSASAGIRHGSVEKGG